MSAKAKTLIVIGTIYHLCLVLAGLAMYGAGRIDMLDGIGYLLLKAGLVCFALAMPFWATMHVLPLFFDTMKED